MGFFCRSRLRIGERKGDRAEQEKGDVAGSVEGGGSFLWKYREKVPSAFRPSCLVIRFDEGSSRVERVHEWYVLVVMYFRGQSMERIPLLWLLG